MMTRTQRDARGFALIQDAPAVEDRFGTHERLAEAMVATMHANPGLRTMGLVGAWGSGKSTALGLFEKVLARRFKKSAPPVFTFDAWLHHGEPVRRAFLEDFYRFCERASPASATDMQAAVDHVTGRSTTTETHDQTRITWTGLLILASIALGAYGLAQGAHLLHVPLIKATLALFPAWLPVLLPALVPGATIAAVALSRMGQKHRIGRATDLTIGLGLLTITAILLVFGSDWRPGLSLPLLIAASTFAGIALIKDALEKAALDSRADSPTLKKDEDGDDDIIGLILSKSGQRKRTRVSGASAPTAIEFADVFQKALRQVFATHRTFVVVIDNLDRLPASEAKDAWAMLRTFFAGSPIIGPEPSPVPLVIVPVAEETVQAMFPNARQSFMDKTFDAVFHVPHPVFTRWQSHLKDCLAATFARAVPAEQLEKTMHLADERFRTEKAITPRDLHTFVNLLATYWLQFRPLRIPFTAVAFYCLHKAEIDEDFPKFIAQSQVSLDAFTSQWRRPITAIHHGVSMQEAAPLFITALLERAVSTGDAELFSANLNEPGAVTALMRLVSTYRKGPVTQDALLNTIKGIIHSVGHSIYDIPTHIWSLLSDAFPVSRPWTRFSKLDATVVSELLTHAAGPHLWRLIINIEACIESIEPQHDVHSSPQIHFWRAVHGSGHHVFRRLRCIHIKGDPNAFIETALAFDGMPAIQERLVPESADSVLVALQADLMEDSAHQVRDTDERLLAVRRTAIDANWAKLTDIAITRIREAPEVSRYENRNDVARLATPLLALALQGRFGMSNGLTSYFESGRLPEFAVQAARGGYWDIAGRAMGIMVAFAIPIQPFYDRGPRTDEAWSDFGSAMGRTARLATDLSYDGMPAFVVSSKGRDGVGFDLTRLRKHADDAFATTRPVRPGPPPLPSPSDT